MRPRRPTDNPSFSFSFGDSGLGDIHISEMWCEYAKDPLGIDTASPRLSWALESEKRNQVQSAYQIIISSSHKLAKKEMGDVWDSGKVFANHSLNIVASA